MRVCYVETLGQKLNGSQQSLLNLIDQLKDKNIEPYLVCHTRWELLSVAEKRGIKTFVVPQKGLVIQEKDMSIKQRLKYPIKLGYNALQVPKAVRFLKENKIDIVHLNTTLTSSIWAEAAKKAGIKYVWHVREFLDLDHNRVILNKKRIIQLLREADAVIAISKAVKAHWDKTLGISCRLIYNGLPLNEYYDEITPDRFDGDINCLIVGRITYNKGQMDAVKAIKRLKERGFSNIRLIVVGYRGISPYELELKKYIEDNGLSDQIELVDYTYDMAQYRRRCQIGLMCSKAEAFGRVTIEYQLAGLAVIGSNSGGTPELISDNETGALYTFGDDKELADKIEALANDREKMKSIAHSGQQSAVSNFTIQRTAENVRKLYDEITQNSGSGGSNEN